MHLPKRLIEVDLPIARISAHSRREKSIRHGHISTLHIWWARRPLAACRAVVLASLWPDPVDLATWGDDDPTIKPDRFLREAREQVREFAPHVEQLLWDKKASPETANAFAEIAKKPALLDGPDSPALLRSLLLHFIADFANWDNSTDPLFLETARTLTQAAHESLGGQPGVRPIVIDPFAGGGSIPLEALRVGADAFASDLNPIPVLLNKVVLEYIPKYGQRLADEVRRWGEWIKEQAEEELAQFYPAQKLKPDAYFPQPKPKIQLRGGGTWHLDGIAAETPIAYLWARTVLSDAPGQGEIPVEIPLMRSMWLAKKSGRKQALRWVRDDNGKVKTRTVEVTFYVQGEPTPRRVKRPILEIFHPKKDSEVEGGTVARGHATCPVTGHVTPVDSVREQLKRRRGGAYDARLFAVVTTLTTKRYTGRREDKSFQDWSEQGRFFRLSTKEDERAFAASCDELKARQTNSRLQPSGELSLVPDEPLDVRGIRHTWAMTYGLERWGDLFSARQALALSVISRLVRQVGDKMMDGKRGPMSSRDRKAINNHSSNRSRDLQMFNQAPKSSPDPNESRDDPYEPGMAEAVQTLLALVLGRQANACTSLGRVDVTRDTVQGLYARQAIGMVWDFAEVNPFSGSSGDWLGALSWVVSVCEANCATAAWAGQVERSSATTHPLPDDSVAALVTDPPYYDAVPYAYLSDFFYVWVRRTLANVHPGLLGCEGVPKDEEIVVDRPHKQSDSKKDIYFYERALAEAFADSRRVVRPDGVGCIVFASKSTSSWEAILKAVIEAGWIVTGSWPIDTEMETRVAAQGQARLGSSVHIVVRPRELPTGELDEGEVGDWRSVLEELPKRIREWMPRLDAEGVVGADAIFACLGPALEVFSRYSRVERASGEAVLLPEYLEHVWATVSTEALSLIFQDADAGGLEPDARLTAMWLWTLRATTPENGSVDSDDDESSDDEDDDTPKPAGKPARGFALEFDAARKIAQGLGVHLEKCQSFVEVKGETARLLSMAERVRHLFGKDAAEDQLGAAAVTKAKGRKKKSEPNLFQSMEEVKAEIEAAEAEAAGKLAASKPGATVLDRVHQAMLLFSTGRGEALRRFIVDDGVGQDARFWKLADSLNKLYPIASEERRAVEGVLARKKSFGF
ncbi:MAG: DUF1156 domain-containing protein [Phycisphaerales bacterium]